MCRAERVNSQYTGAVTQAADVMQEKEKSARVLLLATGRWVSTARLAMALRQAGCDVQLMSLRKHPAALTDVVTGHYRYRPLRPLESVRAAIEAAKPLALIPVDELAVAHLEELLQATDDARFQQLVKRSLGGADVFHASHSRMTLMQAAMEEGIDAPETLSAESVRDVDLAAEQLGLPLVLKADATSGGQGVRMVHSVAEARKAWAQLHRPPSLPRAVWRASAWGEWSHLRSWAGKRHRGVTAQKFLAGGERTAMAVAQEGKVLACVCLEVIRTWKVRGPSSVLRIVSDAAMERAVRAVVRRLGVTGFCGFDFMLAEDGTPLLIEMNPRPTQLAHLPLGEGKDLVAAYARTVLGVQASDRKMATAGDTIALFPQELQRDLRSEFIANSYHDVPWQAPELVRYAIKPLPKILVEDPRWTGAK
jgi:carbamoylphosphate synthase large subunit